MRSMARLKVVLLAAGLMLAAAPSAFALDLAVQPVPNVLTIQPMPNLRLNELQVLQSRQDRLNYQYQQRQYREQDRQQVVPLRPDVPVMRPGCQIQPFGNIFGTVCR